MWLLLKEGLWHAGPAVPATDVARRGDIWIPDMLACLLAFRDDRRGVSGGLNVFRMTRGGAGNVSRVSGGFFAQGDGVGFGARWACCPSY